MSNYLFDSVLCCSAMTSVTRNQAAHRAKRNAASARIIDAAERLLDEGQRFTEIPVERLLAEADVSRSTFYVHFADKSALLIALAAQAVEQVNAVAEVWTREDHRPGPAGAAATVLEMIRVYREHAAVLRTLAEVGAYDDEVRAVRRERREQFDRLIVQRLRRERAAGLVDPDVDIATAATVVSQMVDAAILDHIDHGSAKDDRRLADTLARVGWLAYYGHLPTAEQR
jgi:AcrR family transcriptional regulator